MGFARETSLLKLFLAARSALVALPGRVLLHFGSAIFGHLEVISQGRQRIHRELPDLGVLPVLGLFLEFGDVLPVVFDHRIDVRFVELRARHRRKLVIQHLIFFAPASLRRSSLLL